MTTAHPNRRFFRYSLRSLFIVITLIAILCGFFGKRMVRARREQIAVNQIVSLGGRISYGNQQTLAQDGHLTRWITLLFYEDFARVTHVSLTGPNINDTHLQHLASLTWLEGLELSQTQITGTGLKQLVDLPRLKYINLNGTDVTDSAIRVLKRARPKLFVDR